MLCVKDFRKRRLRVLATAVAALGLFAQAGCRNAESYVSRGKQFYQQAKYDDAALNFRKAIQKDTHSGEALFELGRTELKRNRPTEAYQALSAAVDQMPERADIYVLLGDLLLGAYTSDNANSPALYGRLNEVTTRLERLTPGSFDALRLRAQILLADRRFAEATELLRQADDRRPMQPEVIAPLIKALAQQQEYGEAEKRGLRLISQRKEYLPTYDLLYLLYLNTGRGADAEKILQEKSRNNPKDVAAVLQLADHYAGASQPDRARQSLEPLLGDTSRFTDGPLHAASFLGQHKQFDEALRALAVGENRAADAKTKSRYRNAVAAIYVAQGKTEDAVRIYEEFLRSDSSDDQARSRLALLRLNSSRPDLVEAAVRDLVELCRKYPEDARNHANAASAYLRVNKLEDAQRELNETIRSEPGNIGAKLQLAEVHLRRHQYGQALSASETVLASAPENLGAQLIHAIALTGGGQYLAARSELMRLAKDHPNLVEAQFQLGLLNIREKKYKSADEIFRRLYRPGGDFRPLSGLVSSQVAQNQLDSGMQLLQAEIKHAPGSSAARMLLADLNLRAGTLDNALEQLRAVIAEQPASLEGHLRMGQALQRKGDLQGALANFQKAREIAPKNHAVSASLAQALYAVGKKREATALYRETLRLNPEDPATLNNVAFVLAESSEDLDQALQFALKAQQKIPERSLYRDTVGYVYLQKGMPDSALQVFSGLVKKEPDNATYHYHLGLALMRKGEHAAAKDALRSALANRPSKSEEIEIGELLRKI